MSTTRPLLFVLLLFCFFNGISQEYHFISLIPKKGASPWNSPFYIDSIIDNRSDKSTIGVVQKGMFNKKVEAKFEKGFSREILDFCAVILPEQENRKPLILRINALEVSEKTTAFNESGTAFISLDLLQKIPEGYTLKYRFSDTVKESGMDVTSRHDERIRSLLLTAFEEVIKKGMDKLDNIAVSPDQNIRYEILDQYPVPGFYSSYRDLASLKAVDDDTYKVVPHKKNPYRIHVENSEGRAPAYYALMHNDKLYLNARNYSADPYFVETIRVEKYLLFHDTFINPDKASGMAGAFGLIGVAASNEGNHVLLDLETGTFHIIDNGKMKKALRKINPRLYKTYKEDEKDLQKMQELFEYLFKHEDQKSEVLEILKA